MHGHAHRYQYGRWFRVYRHGNWKPSSRSFVLPCTIDDFYKLHIRVHERVKLRVVTAAAIVVKRFVYTAFRICFFFFLNNTSIGTFEKTLLALFMSFYLFHLINNEDRMTMRSLESSANSVFSSTLIFFYRYSRRKRKQFLTIANWRVKHRFKNLPFDILVTQ